jgi:hypothetical protein
VTVEQKASLLVKSIQNELRLGTKHWDKDGKLLETPGDIIYALVDGEITFEPVPERRELFQGYPLETAEEREKEHA